MSKKFKIVVAVAAALLLVVAILVVLMKDNGSTPRNAKNSSAEVDVVGTWYSDKPDSVTFDEDGNYSFSVWNGGVQSGYFPGTYSVERDSVILQNGLDGTTILTINKCADGSFTLSGWECTYYQTEEAAKAAITAAAEQAAEDEANFIPNTVNKLLGEWTSLDGTTTCTFTESGITQYFWGISASEWGNSAVAEDTHYYEYEITDHERYRLTRLAPDRFPAQIYHYTLTESSDGGLELFMHGLAFYEDYTKGSLSVPERAERFKSIYGGYPDNYNSATNNNAENTTIIDRIITSEKNPDFSEYTDQLNAYVKEILPGEWRGTFDDWPDPVYFTYIFTTDGTYTFSDGEKTETGTYTLTSDPNNNDYHSALQLAFDGGERTVRFSFTTTNPVRMITDDRMTYDKS